MSKLTTATAALLLGSTAVALAADIGKLELPKMHKTFDANPARFDHDYAGKSFASSAIVTDIVKRAPGSYSVTLDSGIVCPDVSVDAAQSFNKGDTVNLAGTVAAYSPQAMELGQCTFSRSVPVDESTGPPKTESRLAPAPAPAPTAMAEPKIIYLPAPPAPQVIYVEPKNAAQAPQAAPTEQELPLPPTLSEPPLQRAPVHKGSWGSYPVEAPPLPRIMTMSCAPADGAPTYDVRLVTDGSVLQIVGGPRFYVTARNDNSANHILYIAAKRHNDVMYFAFDHSQFKDESATLVKANGHDIRAKCSVDWQAPKFAEHGNGM